MFVFPYILCKSYKLVNIIRIIGNHLTTAEKSAILVLKKAETKKRSENRVFREGAVGASSRAPSPPYRFRAARLNGALTLSIGRDGYARYRANERRRIAPQAGWNRGNFSHP